MTTLLPRAPATAESPALQRLGVRPPLREYAGAVWQRRDFVAALALGQLRSRNANTLLGSLWHLLNPLMLAATYFVVFGVFLDARQDVDNYVGFLVTGLFVFYYTQKAMTGGASTIVANAGILRNVNLPRVAFPVGSVLAETLAHLPAIGLLLALLLLTGEGISAAWLLLLPLVALQAVFNLGLALWVGRLTFHFRDMQNLLPFVMRLLLYVSGVFFAASRVPEGVLRQVFQANPIYVFITLHRELLLDGTAASRLWLAAVAWTVASLASGLLFFWSRENSYGLD